jgi:hypothetical protein
VSFRVEVVSGFLKESIERAAEEEKRLMKQINDKLDAQAQKSDAILSISRTGIIFL